MWGPFHRESVQQRTDEQIVAVTCPYCAGARVSYPESPRAQVVKRIRGKRAQQRTVEQYVRAPVPTVQKQVIEQEIPRAQVVKRIRGNIVETIPQERVQRTVPEKPGAQGVERMPKSLDRWVGSIRAPKW